jgi:hypothetical protein
MGEVLGSVDGDWDEDGGKLKSGLGKLVLGSVDGDWDEDGGKLKSGLGKLVVGSVDGDWDEDGGKLESQPGLGRARAGGFCKAAQVSEPTTPSTGSP